MDSKDLPNTESVILTDCKQLLSGWEKKYKTNPAQYYRKLCLLALEREQLVSFAYQDNIMHQRLVKLELEPEIEKVIRYCLLQLWRDEEAHTIYIRSLLVGEKSLQRNFNTLSQQFAGFLSGWSSAMKHHIPRSNAPVRTAIVDILAFGGRLVGKLSPELRAELGYKSFKEYCRYNVDAEVTAHFCWEKLLELDTRLGYNNTETFKRIAREEEEHRQVFDLLAKSFDDQDKIRKNFEIANFVTSLENIGTRLVDPEHRSKAISQGNIGKGGKVHIYGAECGDKNQAISKTLDPKFDSLIGKSVAIKTSWMMGYSKKDKTSVTDPELIRTLVNKFKELGAKEITLIESPNIYSDLYENHDVKTVAKYFDITNIDVKIEDTSETNIMISENAPLGPTRISKAWKQADVRITVCHLRTHPTEGAHLSSANLEGLIAGNCSSVFWDRTYEYYIGATTVGIDAPPDFAIIDAWENCPDGWFGIMAGKKPKSPRRIYSGDDCLAVDLTALSHAGYKDTVASPTLKSLIEWFGDPRPNTNIVGLDEKIEGWRSPHRNIFNSAFSDFACKIYAWLSRSGAVFTPEMDTYFIEKKQLPTLLRPVRHIARTFLGFRPGGVNEK